MLFHHSVYISVSTNLLFIFNKPEDVDFINGGIVHYYENQLAF